jgi:SHAQKYF class myb-like DNA-binding protein
MLFTEAAPGGALDGDDSLLIELSVDALPNHMIIENGVHHQQAPLNLELAMLAPAQEQQHQQQLLQQQQYEQQQQQLQQQQQHECGVGAGGGAATPLLINEQELDLSLDGAFFTPNSEVTAQARWNVMDASSPMAGKCKARALPEQHMQRARSVLEMRSVSSSSGSPRGSSCEMDLASPRGEGLLSGSGGEEGSADPWAAADDGALADDAGAGFLAGRWTDLEHALFLEGMRLFGKKWPLVADHVKTRSPVQIRTHAQKYFIKEARVGVGFIVKADAASAPNIFTMNQPSERLLQQQQSQNARAGKRKPAEIVPLRNKRSSSLPMLDGSGSSLRSLDAADGERDTAHYIMIMGEEVLLRPPSLDAADRERDTAHFITGEEVLRPPSALAKSPRKSLAASQPKSRLKPPQLFQATEPAGSSLGAMLPRDNLFWPGPGPVAIDHGRQESELLQYLPPPPPQHQHQQFDVVDPLMFLFPDEQGAGAQDRSMGE